MGDNKKGTLIVLEGADGTGKTTQLSLLLEYLKQNKIPHKMYDFPQYDSFYGTLIGKYLRGEFGSLETISPYISALFFALDRSTVAKKMHDDLSAGMILVANRYVTSNMAHQGGRFKTDTEKQSFLSWLTELEYKQHHMPREDEVILFDMPAHIAGRMIGHKKPRAYLNGGKKDIQESDKKHRNDTEKMYQYLARFNSHWSTISCVQNGTIRTKEDIQADLLGILSKKGIL